MISVVAALIEINGEFLIGRRAEGDESAYGKWEFPGGKVEPNEDEFRAIEREIMEEFSVEVKAENYLTHSIFEYPNKTVDLKLYVCKYVSGDFELKDHFEIAWVTKDELLTYDLADADIPLAEYIVKNY